MTTNGAEKRCLQELGELINEFYGEDGTAVDERSKARTFISTAKTKVETLGGEITKLEGKVKTLETNKADIAKAGESHDDLGKLVSEVNNLQSLIDNKKDKTDTDIPTDAGNQLNALWKKLYALENKYKEKSWFNALSGFHPTVGSCSLTGVSASATGVEVGFGGLSVTIRVWYVSFDFKSYILNGVNVKADGFKSLVFLLKSVGMFGINGLITAIRAKNAINAAKTELSNIAQETSRFTQAALNNKG